MVAICIRAGVIIPIVNEDKPELSVRSVEVLVGAAFGRDNANIGARLYIAESTVKSCFLRMYSNEINVHDRTHAVAVWMSQPSGLALLSVDNSTSWFACLADRQQILALYLVGAITTARALYELCWLGIESDELRLKKEAKVLREQVGQDNLYALRYEDISPHL
jgi:DNA-binding CsgD family transcriptional regulator